MGFGTGTKEDKEKFLGMIGVSSYLNAKDIDKQGVTIRLLPWIKDGTVCVLNKHLEGWEEKPLPPNAKRGDKPKKVPHRFDMDAQIPQDINWARGTFNDKPTIDSPKPAVAFIAWVYGSGIKLGSFTQGGFIKKLYDLDDENNALYIDNLTEVDLVITKSDDNKLNINVHPKSLPQIPAEAAAALQALLFSHDLYMQGEDPFVQDPQRNNNWEEVKHVIRQSIGNPAWDLNVGAANTSKASPNKVITKPAAQQEAAPATMNWKEICTPAKKPLGQCTVDELEQFKKILEDKKRTDNDLYRAIVVGIAELKVATEKKDDAVAQEAAGDLTEGLDF